MGNKATAWLDKICVTTVCVLQVWLKVIRSLHLTFVILSVFSQRVRKSTNSIDKVVSLDIVIYTAVKPISVAARSMSWVCGRSVAGIAGLNPAGGMDVCLL